MSDQANRLRGLMENRQIEQLLPPDTPAPDVTRARTIAVTSGKGGVGKSNIALNLAIALARLETKVCLIDANHGLGNVDLLCGLNGYWNLSHVMTGARMIEEITLEGPEGIHVVSGAGELADLHECPPPAQQDVVQQLSRLEQSHDFIVLDTGTGLHKLIRRFVAASDVALIVTTPEPTAIADAYATVKAFSSHSGLDLNVVVNQADSVRQAHAIVERLKQTARMFLKTDLNPAGFIPADHHVVAAVAGRVPFVVSHPQGPASQAVAQLARRLHHRAAGPPLDRSFFSCLSRETAKAV